jgi:hypothetical protein
MATPTKVELGAFAQGEVPPPLVVTFTDFDSNVVDLTGFASLQTNIQEEIGNNQNPLGTGTTVLTDAVGGEVTYTWVRDDMADTGEYEAQVWVNNGTNYFASDLYTYSVYDGPGTPPA